MATIFKYVDLLLTNIAFWGSILIPFFAEGFWDGVLKIIILWTACWLTLIALATVRAALDKS